MIRRRILKIMAFSAASMVFSKPILSNEKHIKLYNWHGRALGAESSIQLYMNDENEAKRILENCVNMIHDLENSFNLFDEMSEVSMLNKQGRIDIASTEFIELLKISLDYYQKTNGAFDVTIQPLWNYYKNSKGYSADSLTNILPLIGSDKINIDGNNISFSKEGMSVSLNGIAQGYITDKVVEYLESEGVTSTLVDLGEYRSVGTQEYNEPWRIGLLDPFDQVSISGVVEITSGAVATSGGYGLIFDELGEKHHIFNPNTGQSSNLYASVTVKAENATTADALSTAMCNMSLQSIKNLVADHSNIDVYLTYHDGKRVRI